MRDICIFCWQPTMPVRQPHRTCQSCGFEMYYHVHSDHTHYDYRLPAQGSIPPKWQEIPPGTLLIVKDTLL